MLAIMLARLRRRCQVNVPGNGLRSLEDKAALVTGSSSGVGRAAAIAFVRGGSDIAPVVRSR
jgi:hypothetical protein